MSFGCGEYLTYTINILNHRYSQIQTFHVVLGTEERNSANRLTLSVVTAVQTDQVPKLCLSEGRSGLIWRQPDAFSLPTTTCAKTAFSKCNLSTPHGGLLVGVSPRPQLTTDVYIEILYFWVLKGTQQSTEVTTDVFLYPNHRLECMLYEPARFPLY